MFLLVMISQDFGGVLLGVYTRLPAVVVVHSDMHPSIYPVAHKSHVIRQLIASVGSHQLSFVWWSYCTP